MRHIKTFGQLNEGLKKSNFKKGDLVFVKGVGKSGLVGLVMTDQKNDDYGVPMCKVYFRGLNGDVIEVAAEETVDIIPDYWTLANEKSDLSAYKSIAKKQGITLNPKYDQYEETADEEW